MNLITFLVGLLILGLLTIITMTFHIKEIIKDREWWYNNAKEKTKIIDKLTKRL